MKKEFATFLIFIFLIHYSGFYIYFSVRLVAIHEEIREKLRTLPDEQYETLLLSVSEYQASRTGEGEIEWRGKTYDIGKMSVYSDHLVLYVIHDKAEDDLLSFLNQIIERSEGDTQEEPSQVLDFISLVFIANENKFGCNSLATLPVVPSYIDHFYSFIIPIDSPPPQSRA